MRSNERTTNNGIEANVHLASASLWLFKENSGEGISAASVNARILPSKSEWLSKKHILYRNYLGITNLHKGCGTQPPIHLQVTSYSAEMPQIMPSQLQRGTPHVDAAAGTRSRASTAVGPTCPAAQLSMTRRRPTKTKRN